MQPTARITVVSFTKCRTHCRSRALFIAMVNIANASQREVLVSVAHFSPTLELIIFGGAHMYSKGRRSNQ